MQTIPLRAGDERGQALRTHTQHEKEERPRRPKVQARRAGTWEGAESVPALLGQLPSASSHVEVQLSF